MRRAMHSPHSQGVHFYPHLNTYVLLQYYTLLPIIETHWRVPIQLGLNSLLSWQQSTEDTELPANGWNVHCGLGQCIYLDNTERLSCQMVCCIGDKCQQINKELVAVKDMIITTIGCDHHISNGMNQSTLANNSNLYSCTDILSQMYFTSITAAFGNLYTAFFTSTIVA